MNRTPWFTLGLIAACAALLVAGIATRAAPLAKTFDVDAADYSFAPNMMEAAVDEDLTIHLKNVGARPHDIVFELDNNRVEQSSRIMGGQMTSVSFKAPAVAGEYVFYCSVGQHRALGMEGKLKVTSGAISVDVDAADYSFAPNQIEAKSGVDVTIKLKNVGARLHDIVFELDNDRVEASSRIMGGGTTTMTFKAPAVVGEYVFYCSVGQHRALGMVGKLKVTGVLPLTTITGLNNPHGISANPDGTILVSEGGTGEPKPGMVTPGNGDGRVQRIGLVDAADRTVIVEGLTNAVDRGGGIVGANHAIRWGGAGPATGTASVVLVAQSGGPGQARPEDAAKILKVQDGQSSILADPLAFERANNPGGEPEEAGKDSNPWRLAPGPGGMIYISDAGANDILKMDPASGDLTTYAVFSPIKDNQDTPNDATPTGMAFDPTRPGVAYVAQLAFSVPPQPMGQIRRLEDKNADGDALDEGENTLLVDGLLTPTDLAFGPGGSLFVTEIAPGTLGRIDPACFTAATPCQAAGARTIVATELFGASAIAFDANGNGLVATNDTLPPGRPSTNASNQITRLPASSLVPGAEPPTPEPTSVTPPTVTPPTQVPTSTPEITPTPTGKRYIFLPWGNQQR